MFLLLIYLNRLTAAFIVYIIAALTDAVDGFFARRNKKPADSKEVFDAMADFILVYSVGFAIAIMISSLEIILFLAATIVIIAALMGFISLKKKRISIPHLTSGKIMALVVHPLVLAYIIRWEYRKVLFIAAIAVGVYAFVDYAVYSLKQKTL